MLKKISALKVRQNLGQVMNEVALKDDEYIVERAGKPLVAIISVEVYKGMKKEQEEFFRMADEISKTAQKEDSDLVDKEIEEAVRSYRNRLPQKSKNKDK
ncbi:MAG: type II toxin-antitoxin system prevent-host-death family antitoxin [bacterium]